jgi:DNA-binding MarR family transcriptional regulator
MTRPQPPEEDSVPHADLSVLRWLPSVRLHILASAFRRLAEDHYERRFDLKFLDHRIIGAIGALGEVSFKRVCEEARLEKSYASRLINRLQERGLIEKIGDPGDQRAVVLRLTPEGRRVHGQLQAASAALNERWLSVLRPEQREVFLTCLRLLTDQVASLNDQGVADADLSTVPVADPAGPAPAAPDGVRLDVATARRLYDLLGAALRRA